MNKLAIIADTAQDLKKDLAEHYGIELIYYQVQMGDNHYRDQIDIDSRQFYERMHDYDVLSTGIPPIQDVVNLLDQLVEQGYTQALVITGSLKLTGMRQLYEVVREQYEQLEIFIVESDYIASATGLLAIYASELKKEGKTVQEILPELEKANSQTGIFALFRTLKYVVKGGRFNKYAGIIGSFFNINPLLTILNGEIGVINKARGKKKSYLTLLEAAREKLKGAKRYKIALFAGNNNEEIAQLQKDLADEISKAETSIVTELTPVLGVHAGPQSVGVSILVLE
ncbi:DegV family protein [Facklamia miroungae]|uniref:EDD domain protein, DegV family n=1 Tax=Facklamia miroungae TaxID=120956 RepID=A0A1G7QKX8_9LACT|nr:DegV family protein [Facklamia miroungae]NKZ28978.1 DegV family protein [Facklamia miroungae]SDF99135.1 EDD domain protein, DegV family [Facklamia miroungae]